MSLKNRENDYLIELLGQTEEQEAPSWLKERIMGNLSAHRPKLHHRLLNQLLRPRTYRFRPLSLAVTMAVAVFAFWAGTLLQSPVLSDRAGNKMGVPETIADNALANYLIGRGLLAGNQAESALQFFQKAVELDPQRPEFAHWQGVAFWASGHPEMERQSYSRSIEDDPEYLPSLMYLGHNYLESGNYSAALQYYQQALQKDPQIPEALYNSALAYQKLQNTSEERSAFRKYLHSFRTGKWAYRAVEHLHQLGDFSFRSYRLGNNRVILNMEALLDSSSIEHEQEITHLAGIIKNTNQKELHLVFFKNNDKTAAKRAAISLREKILRQLGAEYIFPIRVSWFDSAETVLMDDEVKKQVSPSLLIFTKSTTNNNRRIST